MGLDIATVLKLLSQAGQGGDLSSLGSDPNFNPMAAAANQGAQAMGFGGSPTGPPPADAVPAAAAPPVQSAPAPGAGMPETIAPPGPTGNISPSDIAMPTAHPGMLRTIWANMAAGGGASPSAVQEIRQPGYRDQMTALKTKQARMLFPNDPTAQSLWASGDPDFVKTVAGNYKDENLPEGATQVRNGKALVRAPKTYVGVDGGHPVTASDDGTSSWGPGRAPSFPEITAQQAQLAASAASAAKSKTEQQAVDQTGAKIDSDITNDAAKAAEDKVVQAAGQPGGLQAVMADPGSAAIFRTWVLSKSANVFGGGAAADKIINPPAKKAGGVDDPRGNGGGAPAAPSPMPAAAGAAPGTVVRPPPAVAKKFTEGQFYNGKNKAGAMRRWKSVNGTLVDQGPAT